MRNPRAQHLLVLVMNAEDRPKDRLEHTVKSDGHGLAPLLPTVTVTVFLLTKDTAVVTWLALS
jgi:hypothetical protein